MALRVLESDRLYFENSLARRGVLQTLDPCLCELHSGAWDVSIVPLNSDSFDNQKDYLVTPNITVYRDIYASDVQVSGTLESDTVAFVLPLENNGDSRYLLSKASLDHIPITRSTSITARFSAGEGHLFLLLKWPFLEGVLPTATVAWLKECSRKHWLPLTDTRRLDWVNWLLGLLSGAKKLPLAFTNTQSIAALERDCVDWLVQAAASGSGVGQPVESKAVRHRGYMRALEYMDAKSGEAYSIPALCQFAGVSQRTLEYAFRENLGMSPTGYGKNLRYHALRRKLLLCLPGETTIQSVALDLGLYQLGRVASEYLQLFGEHPSVTLKRSPTLLSGGVRFTG